MLTPTPLSFVDTVDRCRKNHPVLTFLERDHHSDNCAVNQAFQDHKKSFIRKNRAIDWILENPVPDIEATREKLMDAIPTDPSDPQEDPFDISQSSEPNLPWGDIMQQKQRRHSRFFFQNVRGLQTTRRNSNEKWSFLLCYASNQGFDVMGVAETCTNTNKHRVKHNLQTLANKVFIQANLHWSNNDFITETNYRPGGTLTATLDSWVGRISRQLQDPHHMGRWCGNEYKLGNNRRLFVITAYRVCKQSSTLGLISSFRQQVLKLQLRGVEDQPCPRRYFIKDFVAYMASLDITNEDHVLLMIDANESLNEDIFGISTLMEKLGLVDLFTRHHQRSCEIATHHTSSNKRIDFILGSADLLCHIAACGYTEFYESVDTDHRGLFIDFKSSLIDSQSRISRSPQRLIGSNTSRAEVHKYKIKLTEYFTSSKIFSRAEELYNKAKETSLTESDIYQLHDLDAEVTRYMLQVEEETCSKKPPLPWSPAVHQAALVIKYWTLQYRNRRKQYDITAQLSKIREQLDDDHMEQITNSTGSWRIRLHKAKIQKQLLHLRTKAKKKEARQQLIQQEAAYRHTEEDHEKQRLAMKDETHHLFRYLKKIYGKRRSMGIAGIEIPFRDKNDNLTNDPNLAVTWMKVNDPDQIVQHLLQRNIQHFGQAQGTPFTVAPVVDWFGFHGTGPIASALIHRQKIPNGGLNDASIPEGAKAILDKLADGRNLGPVCDDISYESFWKAIQVWDEFTSTSPSGRHLGHYRALIMPDGQDHLYNEDSINPSVRLKKVYFHIALAATLSGNTLPRWCNSSTMIIEKVPGQPRINKLRVIHIFEADFNLMLKLLWSRRLAWHVHKKQRLHEAQAGSRPDHRCIDVVLRKTMNYLYASLTRTPLITIDNDAKACYDRIICNLAMLVSRYFGMTAHGCEFLSKTLHNMKYRIRTAAGDSQECYRHTSDTPIHGTGQGSCASPSIWLLQSSLLLECHGEKAFGMNQYDVFKTKVPRVISAEGFVDDVANFTNLADLSSFIVSLPLEQQVHHMIQLMHRATHDINVWRMLLEASGGKLELLKCFWYLLWWSFNRYGDPIAISMDEFQTLCNESISIGNGDPVSAITLEQKDISDSHRTLGAYKSMDGNEEKQYEILLEKSNKLALDTKLGQLSRFQARRAFTSIYIPSMTYSLVSTTQSRTELKAIQSKAIQAFLPAMGYERTFPHAVVFASRQMGGLNIGDLYTECCVAKIGAVIEHIRAGTGLGEIMAINLNWLQMQVGFSSPILMETTTKIPHLRLDWFTHLREFLHSIRGSIHISNVWHPKLERQRDSVLMDAISKLNVPPREIRICNNWRIYFKASTLADITTADGKFIHDKYWKVMEATNERRISHRQSKLNWPLQACPDRSTFKLWKKCIKLAFGIRNNQQLPIPLGDWITSPSTSENVWDYYLQPTTNTLFHNTNDGKYEIHNLNDPQSRFSSTLKFDNVPDEQVDVLPVNTIPVTTQLEYNTLRVRGAQYLCQWHINQSPHFPETFEEYITRLPLWKHNLLMHWETMNTDQVISLLDTAMNTVLVATDGGFDGEFGSGSFGAVIGNNEDIVARISGAAPGRPDLHCAFRSEMYGVLAAFSLLNELLNYYAIDGKGKKITVITFIDSKSVIQRISKHRRDGVPLGDMLSADMDIELQILHELKEIETKGFIIAEFKHVKSHQDDKVPYYRLSRDAQLNVEADRLVNMFSKSDCIRQPYSVPSKVTASLYIHNTAITSKYKECLRHESHSTAISEYMIKKWEWPDIAIQQIWWQAHGSALRKLSHSDRLKIQKFNFYHLPTNRRLSKFHAHINKLCLTCNAEETDDHIIWCHSGDKLAAKQIWENDVHHYLYRDSPNDDFRKAMLVGFHHWVYNKPIPSLEQYFPTASQEVKAAYRDQTSVGWNHFVRGRLSILWQPLIVEYLVKVNAETTQTLYVKKKPKINTSKEWAAGLIVSIWHGVLILWDLRNREIHGPKGEGQSSAEKYRLVHEARAILEGVQMHTSREFEWFCKPLTELEQYSVLSLRAWVRNARMMVRMHRIEMRKTFLCQKMGEGDLPDANSIASTRFCADNIQVE